jgi:hypothetical protein
MSSTTPASSQAATPGRVGSPVSLLLPLRLFGGVILSSLWRIIAYTLAGAALMVGAGTLLGQILPDAGVLAAFGRWSLLGVYAVAGLVGGALWGLNAASARVLRAFEEQAVTVLGVLTPATVEALVPEIPVDQLHAKYDRILEEVVEQTFGRVRAPRLLRRLLEERMRQAAVDAFLADCSERGVETVGFGEMRDWLVRRGVPLATAPARMSIRFWRYVLLTAWLVVLGATVALALPSTWPSIAAAVPALSVGLGLLTLVIGLPRARLHQNAWRWRLGILVLGVSVGGWPTVYTRLAGAEVELGLVWLVVLTATVASFTYGMRQAFIEADRPL